MNREPVVVRRPEKDTRPKLFYKGAHQATLDPIAARRPDGGLVHVERTGQRRAPGRFRPSRKDRNNVAPPRCSSYDVPHRAPWDWRVSLYTWTKAIAAGVYLVRRFSSSPAGLSVDERALLMGGPDHLAASSWRSREGF